MSGLFETSEDAFCRVVAHIQHALRPYFITAILNAADP